MTVQNVIVKNIYPGNGSTTKWPYTFACPDEHRADYIKVYIRNSSGVLAQTTDFSFEKDETKGETYVVYPVTGTVLTSAEKIVIARELPLYQLLNLVNQGPFYAEDLEVTYDELCMMIQQLNEKLGRSLKVGIDIDQDKDIDVTIPVPTDDKNYGIRMTKDGFALVNDPSEVYEDCVAEKEAAETAKTSAQNAASVSQAWAVGEGDIEEIVGTTTPTYSSKTWAESAEQIAIPAGSITNDKIADNTLTYDKLVIGTLGYVTPQMFGAKGDGTTDDTTAFQQAINASEMVLVPAGTYLVGDLIVNKNNFRLEGLGGTGVSQGAARLILKSGSSYILDIALSNNTNITGVKVNNICFDGAKNTADTLVRVHFGNFIRIENCTFTDIIGTALELKGCMESMFDHNAYRYCGVDEHPAVLFETDTTSDNVFWNCNNIHFDHNTMGVCSGNWIGETGICDLIWIDHNKFEFDGTWKENVTTDAYFEFNYCDRTNITDNGFCMNNLSSTSGNNYNTLIRIKDGLQATVCNNHLAQSKGIFLDLQGNISVFARNNIESYVTWDAYMSINCTSVTRQDLENVRQASIYRIGYTIPNYISSHKFSGAIKPTYAYDEDSINISKTAINITKTWYNFADFNLAQVLPPNTTSFKLYIRGRATTEDTQPNIMIYDGSIGNKGNVSFSYAAGWLWKSITLNVVDITSGTLTLMTNYSNRPVLVDGVYFEKVS